MFCSIIISFEEIVQGLCCYPEKVSLLLALYLFIIREYTKQDILSACGGAQAGLNKAMPGYDKKNPLSDCLITDFFEIFYLTVMPLSDIVLSLSLL